MKYVKPQCWEVTTPEGKLILKYSTCGVQAVLLAAKSIGVYKVKEHGRTLPQEVWQVREGLRAERLNA